VVIVRGEKGLGGVIRRWREKRGLSQTELARRARLRQKTISDLENGAPPSFRSLTRILVALDLEIDVVARRVDPPEVF
jgi:HTH-type transcriptional regulator/antitoxin HipB